MDDLGPEVLWLRPRVIRMRAMLRYAKAPRIETELRELIADAESRLESLDEWARAGKTDQRPRKRLPQQR
jgi:hypothetical protein